jgi:hypothetical protein
MRQQLFLPAGFSRRQLLRAGFLGLAGLTLPDYLRAKALAGPAKTTGDDLSFVLVWLDGGPPQHETYDPKPDAPAEYRGPLKAIDTKIPGVQVSELLPKHARLMDKLAIIRSMHHDNGDHFAAAHWMLTGFLGSNALDLAAQYPSMASVITKIKGAKQSGMPAYVGLPNTHSVGLSPGYHGAAYLGVAHNPFNADGDPNNPGYNVPNIKLPNGVDPRRLDDRRALLSAFDTARRDIDASGLIDGLDRFGQQAFEIVTGPAARQAFDLSKESPHLRDLYGRHTWGQSALLARRLVEAGVRFVTLTFGGWDMHSSIERATRNAVPMVDSAVGTLVDDLDARGMLDKTMVIVMGEFGRTPRMNTGGVPGADPVPGRDHWGEVMSVLIAGGGVRGGQTIGASNAKGEIPKDRPIMPQDLAVTLYHRLGINPETAFVNRAGRPIPIGSNGKLIEELV